MADEDIVALENALASGLTQDNGDVNLTEDTSAAPALPAEYADKSPADLAKMLQDAQAMIGRQSAEVGEMRRFTEQLMARENERIETSQLAPEATAEFKWDDDNPAESIGRLVESTLAQKMRGIEEKLSSLTQYTATQQLNSEHSDWQDIVGTDEFRNYANASPIKQELYNRANQGDLAAAKELIGTYKELRGAQAPQSAQTSPVRSAALESSNPNVTRAASGKPVLRRADIVKLQTENPRRYRELLPEIRQAYLEGRVK